MLMTAAGTIPPAKVLVLGAGVAGLQALATARRLGAQTTGYDVRPEVAEQVRIARREVARTSGIEASGEGGYARELSEEERARAAAGADRRDQGLRRRDHDGARAGAAARRRWSPPRRSRACGPASVIVDLAGESGGNCELTEPGETIVAPRRHDRLAAEPPGGDARARLAAVRAQRAGAARADASSEEGELALDFDDEIIAGACVVRDGEIVDAAAPSAPWRRHVMLHADHEPRRSSCSPASSASP